MKKITRALVSVSDKTGVAEFCAGLVEMGVEILSTGGTARLLRENGIPVKDVSEHTGFPEMLDGRVKTLHPLIHGGILFMRSNPEHVRQVRESGIAPIDMVVCNLYPFEKTVARPDVTLAEAIENIDIGGPSMVRAAAKNHADVAVVVSPEKYGPVLDEMRANGGALGRQTRFELALAAFRHTARYDAAISQYLSSVGLEGPPPLLWLELDRTENLARGLESDSAAVYSGPCGVRGGIADSSFAAGPEPTAADLAALGAAASACEPCGPDTAALSSGFLPVWLRTGESPALSLRSAAEMWGGRPVYLAVGRGMDEELALVVREHFESVLGVAAPSFESAAVKALTGDERWGRRVKLLAYKPLQPSAGLRKFFPVEGGFIVEEPPEGDEIYDVLSSREPGDRDWFDAVLARGMLRFYPPASCVLVSGGELVGFSAAEPDEVSAVQNAVRRASKRARDSFAALGFPLTDASLLPRLFSAGIRGVVCNGAGSLTERFAAVANRYKAVFMAVSRGDELKGGRE